MFYIKFYITGDTHGDFEKVVNFCKENKTTKDDVIIILGDAGINFHLSKRDSHLKQRLQNLPITIFSIQGNHEIRPTHIKTYLTKDFCGGIVYYEKDYPNILFAKDGEIYDFNNVKTMAIGGAFSVDKYYRLYSFLSQNAFLKPDLQFDDYAKLTEFIRGKDVDVEVKKHFDDLCEAYQNDIKWWADEQPSNTIKTICMRKLEKNNVDCIIAHTCPYNFMPVEMFLPGVNQDLVDSSTEKWLQIVYESYNILKWYCGHYHTDKVDKNVQFLFNKIENFGDDFHK